MTKSSNTKTTTESSEIDTKLESFTTTSAKIRYLDSLNYTRSSIAKKLDIRYQHVRNVLITPVAKTKENV